MTGYLLSNSCSFWSRVSSIHATCHFALSYTSRLPTNTVKYLYSMLNKNDGLAYFISDSIWETVSKVKSNSSRRVITFPHWHSRIHITTCQNCVLTTSGWYTYGSKPFYPNNIRLATIKKWIFLPSSRPSLPLMKPPFALLICTPDYSFYQQPRPAGCKCHDGVLVSNKSKAKPKSGHVCSTFEHICIALSDCSFIGYFQCLHIPIEITLFHLLQNLWLFALNGPVYALLFAQTTTYVYWKVSLSVHKYKLSISHFTLLFFTMILKTVIFLHWMTTY